MRIEEPGGPDAATVDVFCPVYQVTIFEPLDEPADLPPEQRSVMASEWKLRDVDVPEVLAWAKEKAGPHNYVVEVATPVVAGEALLLRLFGQDPTWGDPAPDSTYHYVPGVTSDQF